jgi:nitrite reductase (NADH) large subunit
MKVCIIGGGIGAYNVAEELVKQGNVDIHIFSEEKFLPYNRIYILDVLSGKKTLEQILLKDEAWYKEHGIEILLNTKITKIYPKDKTFVSDKGETFSYDKLILATGSVPKVPPIEGVNKENVFFVNNIEDIYKISNYAKHSKKAAVIGGGFIGIEGAKALKDIGLQTTIVHIFDTLMENWLDKEASDMLVKYLKKLDIDVLLSKKATKFSGDKLVDKIEFSDGTAIETDFVILATGVSPNVELAKNSGLNVNKGIVVNEYLETSETDIYAIGDCIEFQGKTFGSVAPIMDQIKVCTKNILNANKETYTMHEPDYAILKSFDISIVVIGNTKDEANADEIIYKNTLKDIYKKVIIKNGLITGAILYNTHGFSEILHLAQSKTSVLGVNTDFLVEDLIEKSENREFDLSHIVCRCNFVTYGTILKAIENGAKTVQDIEKMTKAGTSCGACIPDIKMILSTKVKDYSPTSDVYTPKTNTVDFSIFDNL